MSKALNPFCDETLQLFSRISNDSLETKLIKKDVIYYAQAQMYNTHDCVVSSRP